MGRRGRRHRGHGQKGKPQAKSAGAAAGKHARSRSVSKCHENGVAHQRNANKAKDVQKPQTKSHSSKKLTADELGFVVKEGMTRAQVEEMKRKLQLKRAQKELEQAECEEESEQEEVDNDDEDDYSDTANERPREYRPGGYHPVMLNDVYCDRYRIVKKLGWGFFSTVWLVWDYANSCFQAMKVQKSADSYREAAYDEISLLDEMSSKSDNIFCTRLTDHFEYRGPNGVHVCMLFDVLGENLLTLMERYGHRGIPIPIVKSIARDVLKGLDHIHTLGIIHTDLKPENVLISKPKQRLAKEMRNYKPPPKGERFRLIDRDVNTLTKAQKKRYARKLALAKKKSEDKEAAKKENNKREGEDSGSESDPEAEVLRYHHVCLADFGNSCHIDQRFTGDVQTRQYRAPEVLVGDDYSTPIDIWSCACMIFELITGEFLFDPKQGQDYSRDDDHLALMCEMLGEFDDAICKGNGRLVSHFFNSKGQMRRIKDLNQLSIMEVLCHRHGFTEKKSAEIASFLQPMLEFDPSKRATAAEMLDAFDDWFEVLSDDFAPACYVPKKDEEEEDDGEGTDGNEDSFLKDMDKPQDRAGFERPTEESSPDDADGEYSDSYRDPETEIRTKVM